MLIKKSRLFPRIIEQAGTESREKTKPKRQESPKTSPREMNLSHRRLPALSLLAPPTKY
jgi:hypothetical protein